MLHPVVAARDPFSVQPETFYVNPSSLVTLFELKSLHKGKKIKMRKVVN